MKLTYDSSGLLHMQYELFTLWYREVRKNIH